MSRSIFYGFGAWVGGQKGRTTCAWWPDDPAGSAINFDQSKLIVTDLGRHPQAQATQASAAKAGAPAIEVDDPPSLGGPTKLGPSFPTGSMINSIWLESNYWKSLTTNQPPRPPPYMQCRDYELTTVLYSAGPMKGRRFYGFYAEITSEQSQNALCSIWPAGKSLIPGQPPAGSWWINLQTSAHPIEPGLTEIGLDPKDPKKGALFLDIPSIGNLQLASPKLPPLTGIDRYPRPR